ncbi:MAG: Tim44 domain-containing protein [Phenylobacterium sp.]
MTNRLWPKVSAVLGVALALSMIVAQPADARRGGSFGGRGSRTYSQPAPTATAPGYTAPVQRSMTSPGAGGAYAPRPGTPGYAGYQPGSGYGYNNGGLFRGGMGGFFGGLVAGGLIGGLFGHHWGGGWGGYGWGGGGGGFLTIIIQLLILFFVVNLVMRMFRRRAGYSAFDAQPAYGGPAGPGGFGGGGFGGAPSAAPYVPTGGPSWDIPISPQDQAQFETLFKEVQDCFGREDYAGLRERCTPEVVSYLSEELSENATHNRRNEVTGTRLLQADVGEAWREGDVDYATASMRYESIDIMRDRTSGAVLSDEPNTPSQTTELWTFARHTGGPWKLSAIQETQH